MVRQLLRSCNGGLPSLTKRFTNFRVLFTQLIKGFGRSGA
jgi:hypothetical protein